MDRVHQGLAGPVFPVKPVKIGAADLKGRDPSGSILDPDPAQVTAFAQEKGTYEDVRGLIRPGDRSSPPFDSPRLIFSGRYDRRRVSSASRRGVSQAHQLSPLVKDWKLMGFFDLSMDKSA